MLIQKVRELSKIYRFFNWDLEFPDVFEREEAGFNCILTNPPWEVMHLKENEFFTGKSLKIEEARTQAIRRREIKALKTASEKDKKLHIEYSRAWHQQKKVGLYIRNSGLFPLSARGTLNTYQLFVERCWRLLSSSGRTGIVVPTGIVTGFFLKDLFAALVEENSLVSCFDFINTRKIFPIHGQFRFSLITLRGTGEKSANIPMSFFNTETTSVEAQVEKIPEDESEIASAIIQLPPDANLLAFTNDDFKLLSPNTLTCPQFRTRKDSDLTRHLYKQSPILMKRDRKTGKIISNPWEINFLTMFHTANDSRLFHTVEQLKNKQAAPKGHADIGGHWITKTDIYIPIYEGKMIWYYDNRYNSVIDTAGQQGSGSATSIDEYQDPKFKPIPRYWIKKEEFEKRVPSNYNKNWFFTFRDITNSTNERTMVASVIPKYASVDTLHCILSPKKARQICMLLANISSIIFDYITRQKVAGTHMKFYNVEQFPVFGPDYYADNLQNLILSRTLELIYTNEDMKPLATDLDYYGEPFSWDSSRRAVLMAEIDAIFAHLYRISKEDLEYILEQFPVLKKNDINTYDEYRTKRLILEAYDTLGPQLEEMLNE